ncbi:hypothetical protein Ctha_2301 [Chloroherpeton thalassium ATCC 35110]|uniref:GWxTD domain-containing protein n=1 Tax=Chloroherpeton thalassium (strain ATCC 35110 / GB-78) TaxID=517418 RepID=B3QWJ2_CHLT3|nr:GWxTD domain-containing protein [Chloroherpeton thalassium]ACF14752.1 hypothetical protein Ctha_2301 [Chloroherpeton thalassium ATCC 35110]
MLICLSASAVGQERYLEIVRKYGKPNLFIEAVKFPASSPDSLRLLVNFKVSYNYLVFVKSKNDQFSAEALFSVEVLKEGLGAGRQIVKRSVVAKDFAETEEKQKYVSASLEMRLATGKYEFIAEVLDNQNQKPLTQKKETLDLTWNSLPIRLSDPLFLDSYTTQKKQCKLIPLAFSGKGLFGKKYTSAVEVFLPKGDSLAKLQYELLQISGDDSTVVKSGVVEGRDVLPISPIHEGLANFNTLGVVVTMQAHSECGLALIDFNSSELDNAKYKLVITAESKQGNKGRMEKEFENAWIDMPYPLYDIDLALRLMTYILSPKAIDELEVGNAVQRRNNFKQYWKKKDPTPETAFNEVMAEYFRRVDYAFFNFYTTNEYGWRTDRGRIYILYGEPHKVDRVFPINEPTRESWFYDSPINKKFIFSDQDNNGNYKLVSESRFSGENKGS